MRLTRYTITHDHDECTLHITDCNLRQVRAGDHTHGLGCDCPLPTSPSLERQRQKCHMKQERCCMKEEQPWNMPWRISAWGWAGSLTRVCAAAPPVLLQLQSWVTAKEHTEDKQMPLFLECMHCSFICAVALFSMYSHSSSAPPLRSCLEATSQL